MSAQVNTQINLDSFNMRGGFRQHQKKQMKVQRNLSLMRRAKEIKAFSDH